MRTIALLCLLVWAPMATAQTPCTETSPCTIPLDVDETSIGFGASQSYAVTAGDWFVFDAFNLDDAPHDITIADLGIEFQVPAFDQGDDGTTFGPYLFDAPGTYQVTDLTSGATAPLDVLWEDVSEEEPGNDTPGISWALVVAGIAVAAFRRR